MAGPISHVIFAEKLQASRYARVDDNAFMLGNLFPDIRYLNVVDRMSTHHTCVTLDMIADEKDDFQAGILFHSYIDETREAFVKSMGIYSRYHETHLISVALKLCEDLYLYSRSDNWDHYKALMSHIADEELATGIPIESLKKWHDIHAEYFVEPSLSTAHKFLEHLGFSSTQIKQIIDMCVQIQQTKEVDDYIDSFYEEALGCLV